MRIILAAGGTAGHIFPACEVAALLRQKGHEIIFVGALESVAEKIKQQGFAVYLIKVKGLTTGSWWGLAGFLIAMVSAVKSTFGLLKTLQPQAVCGFGGYGAFPVVFSAAVSGYPTALHEQNVIPGKANRLLAFFADKIAVSFKESLRYFPVKKVVHTGCPCREKKSGMIKKEIQKKFNLQPNVFTILVLGGSQGSHRVNEVFFDTAVSLGKDLDFQVIHLTGKKDFADLQSRYQRAGIKSCLFDFLDRMQEAYAASDLAVCRAGAVTVCELAKFALPAILIPYPFAGGHQKENARVLARSKTARIIEEKDLSAEELRKTVLALAQNRLAQEEIARLRKEDFFADATERLAKEIAAFQP